MCLTTKELIEGVELSRVSDKNCCSANSNKDLLAWAEERRIHIKIERKRKRAERREEDYKRRKKEFIVWNDSIDSINLNQM
jgi:hypothetical protein